MNKYFIKRTHNGTPQYYAGVNTLLGAPRWSEDIQDADRMTLAQARLKATVYNGIVSKIDRETVR